MRSFAATVSLGLAGAVVGAAQTSAPAIVVRAPVAETVLVGRFDFVADVTPVTGAVRYVAFFVDGTQVCRVTVRPYSCAWDAGVAAARSIRVVAELTNGLRLVKMLQTAAPSRTALSFRAGSDAVVVPVEVYDSSGRPVGGLTRTEFRIIEDGVPQEITSLLPQTTATSVLLALDSSTSMIAFREDLIKGAEAFLAAVGPHDAVSIATFNAGFYVLTGLAASPAAQRSALARIKPTGSTALYDNLVRAAELIQTQPSPRVLVVFTDGMDTASRATLAEVRTALQSRHIALYLVLQGERDQGGSAEDALVKLARDTGGTALFTKKMDALKEQFVAITTQLKNRYVLVYTPATGGADGVWRSIEVEIRGREREYEVRSRTGYVTGSPLGATP